MGKFYEVLAVAPDAEGVMKKVNEEGIVTFSKKPDHFIALQKKLEMFDESKKNENTEEFKEMVTTVFDKLDYLAEHNIRYVDVKYQADLTNQVAKADLIVEGMPIARDVPATFLLGLESYLKTVRGVFESIPTLAPGIKWIEAPECGKGVYRAEHPDVKMRTAKTFQHKVLTAATDKHPAQIEKWEEQIPVGKYITTTQCSMMSPAQKSHYLGKIDKLIQAAKQARQRANAVDVVERTIGKELFAYIMS